MSAAAIVHPKLAKASFEKALRPLLTAQGNFEKVGVRFLAFSFPYLDVELDWHLHQTKIQLRIDGTDFPYRPVSGWWIDSDQARLSQGVNGGAKRSHIAE